MDSNRIDILLNRYWECETSLEEEKELREFFSSHGEDERWAQEAALFRYFEETRSSGQLGEFFDHRILEQISAEEPVRSKATGRQLWMNIGKVAAVVLILVTASVYFVKDLKDPRVAEQIETYEDPKKAFEETKKALLMISNSMNTGRKQVEKVSIFNEATETIKNTDRDGDGGQGENE